MQLGERPFSMSKCIIQAFLNHGAIEEIARIKLVLVRSVANEELPAHVEISIEWPAALGGHKVRTDFFETFRSVSLDHQCEDVLDLKTRNDSLSSMGIEFFSFLT